ncbi:MAG TPA: response regulator transcription factor [Chloroflexota bacterium]|nr:response regulator transcription factor [Chloroflexota bacterium]
MASILIAEDNPAHRALARFVLEDQGGHHVCTVESAATLLHHLDSANPDLLVLDVVLPGQDGFDLCRQLRRQMSLPILFVSSRSDPHDKVIGLRAGADDYLAKPFDPVELVERVNSLLRRARRWQVGPTGTILRAGDLRLELIDRTLFIKERGPIPLTSDECRILLALLSRPGDVWSRELLLRKLWDSPDYAGPANAVESHVSRLRRKMERNPRHPVYLTTVRGQGYLLEVTEKREHR